MTATESLAGFDEEEWTILYSTPEAAYPPYPHLALPAPVPPQNSQQMYGSPPEYPAFQSVANQNHPTIYSPWSHLSRAVDSVTTGLGRLALHTPAAIPPTFSQQHPSPITPLAPSTGNEPLSAPAAHPTALPASMQSRSSRRARTDSLADFIGRENGRSVCMWTNSAGEVCGYGSRYGLVKRHVRRVHLRVRYCCSLTTNGQSFQLLNLFKAL